MPFNVEHYLVAFGGPMYGSTEEWSCSLRANTTGASGTSDQAVCDSLATLLSSKWSGGQFPVGGAKAQLGWVKYNRVGVDGKYLGGSTILKEVAPPVGAGATTYPPQVSLVATLETGLTRGLAHRGRMFLPVPRYAVGADGRISATDANGAAAEVAALLTAMNGLAGFGTVVVASKTRAGDQRTVTGVTVGRVLDTMRSRRTSLGEERSPVSAVAGF